VGESYLCVDGMRRVCLVEDIGWFKPVSGDCESFSVHVGGSHSYVIFRYCKSIM
jgi:hypothetical protein